MLMYAIDVVLEWSSEFFLTYASFLARKYPIEKEKLKQEWLDNNVVDKLLVKLQALHEMMKVKGPYLVANYMTIADLMMFAHFWKLGWNPSGNPALAVKVKTRIAKKPIMQKWCHQMNIDLAEVFPNIA